MVGRGQGGKPDGGAGAERGGDGSPEHDPDTDQPPPGGDRGGGDELLRPAGGTDYSSAPHQNRAQVFYFIRGAGKVQIGSMGCAFSEVAACCAPGSGPVVIQANGAPLEYLEILMELQPW